MAAFVVGCSGDAVATRAVKFEKPQIHRARKRGAVVYGRRRRCGRAPVCCADERPDSTSSKVLVNNAVPRVAASESEVGSNSRAQNKVDAKRQSGKNTSRQGRNAFVRAMDVRSVASDVMSKSVDAVDSIRSLALESTAIAAIVLAIRVLLGKLPPVSEERVTLPDGVQAIVFRRLPQNSGSRRAREKNSTIVMAHGLNPYGMEDTRVQKIARGFASLGFIVVMPEIVPFKECRITEAAVDTLVSVLNTVAGHRKLCRSGQISIFGASMSGSCGIIAACDPSVSPRVSAILCVGAFNSVLTASTKAMQTQPEEDSTARNLLLYNFLSESYESDGADDVIGHAFDPEERAGVYHAAKLSVIDGTSCTPSDLLTEFLRSRPTIAREFWRLQNDVPYRLAHAERIIPRVEPLMELLSPQNYVEELECRLLVIVHGYEDPVNHYTEAVDLHRRISARRAAERRESGRRAGPRSHLCLTPLITHGERAPFKPWYLPSVADVIFAVYTFLRAADSSPAPSTQRRRRRAHELPPRTHDRPVSS